MRGCNAVEWLAELQYCCVALNTGVTIIPELEGPGHSSAMRRSDPYALPACLLACLK